MRYNNKNSVLFFIILFVAHFAFSQTNTVASAKPSWSATPFQRKAFIENKGQLTSGLPADKTNYSYVIDNGTKVFFYKNEVVFCLTKAPKIDKDRMEEKKNAEEEREREEKMAKKETQFISLKWLNANPDAIVEVSGQQQVDYGFIISDKNSKNYTAHCKGYDKLKIKNLYNGVDIEYFFNEKEGFKYNLYVAAGADISQIQQQYSGAKAIKLQDGNIVIKTINGDVIDHAPVYYLADNPSQKTASNFILKKNNVAFNIPATVNQALVIDPWVTVPTMPNNPGDNGVDQYGNTYVTNGHYVLEKYSPMGVLLISTDVMGGLPGYYGDMLTDSRGYCFFNTMGSHARGDATGVDSAGNFLWDSFGITECWRFVLNECTHQVLSLTGYRHSSTGFAKINTETGALVGYTQSGTCCQDPHCGVIDYNGDVYSVASVYGGNTQIYKFTPLNTVAATYPAVGTWGYGTGYVSNLPYTQGYNGMTILGNNLYIFDGATLFKLNKTNGSIVNQVTVPNGVNKHNGGIYITSCGKIFVGSSDGVYMYDINFNQIDFKSTTGAVYDLAFNTFNQTISACGPGHISEVSFVIPQCVFQTQPFIQPSCAGNANGYIKLNLTGGVPDYTYAWSSNGASLSQTTDSIGGLIPGSYKCIYTDNKCPIPNVDSITLVVPNVITTPNFTSSNVCLPLPINLTDSSHTTIGTINSWLWKLGDNTTSNQQNTTHLYGVDSSYNVQLLITTSNGCVDSTTKVVTVYPKPHANFTFTNKCDGAAVPLNSTSTIRNPGVLSSWNWNFGDNISGTGSSTTHTYGSPGNYDVKLIVTSANSCSDTIVRQDTVYNNPVASFTQADICLGDSMSFNSNSTVSLPAAISTYLWNFGSGGATSALQNPKYKYSLPGTYSVILVTTTANSCSDAASVQVNVYAPPVSNFSVNDICLFDTAVFSNSSTNPTLDSIGTWTWNFGDGITNSTVWSPHHVYADTGKYYVSLITRTSILSCADTLNDSLLVFPMPLANYTVQDVCLGEFTVFNDLSTVTGTSTITTWRWNFDDSSPLNTHQSPGHLYASNNTYDVRLIVETNNGCKDTVNHTVVIHPNPIANYSTANVCDGITANFVNSSTIVSTDTIVSWRWDFGDGAPTSTTVNTSHLYASPGIDSVKLLVVSQFGCKDSIAKAIVINPNPIVDFNGIDSIGCEPLCVNFHDLSSVLTGANVSWLWSFGVNGATSTNENPIRCYSNDSVFSPMLYTISLTVTSDSGCVTTKMKPNYITVYPKPIASFVFQPSTVSIINPIVSINNLSTGANFWSWTLGDGDTSTQQYLSPHTYADTGYYVATLLTITNYGCVDSSAQTVFVEPSFLIYIPNSFSPNEDGVNDYFTANGVFIKEFEMSIFDRWGNLIFKTNDIAKPWDGKSNGGTESSQQDVYVYSIKCIDYMGNKHLYKGTVTLIK